MSLVPSRARGRLGRTAAVLALAATATVAGMAMSRPVAELGATEARPTHDAWLTALKGKHRQLFDAPNPEGGIPLVHVMNYYDTFNQAFQTPDKDVNGVLTFYGRTTFLGLNDAMWAKYGLGEFLGMPGADGKPATVNPWRAEPVILGMKLAPAGIEALQRRGASFIICNNALTIFSGLLAQQKGLDPAAVYADMKANILPQVTLVPAMVIAIDQAQQAGLSYHRQ